MNQLNQLVEKYQKYILPTQGSVLEIGSSHSDQIGSSHWLYQWSQQQGLDFVTIDIDRDHCQQLTTKGIPVINSLGELWLKDFSGSIALAYLDNFDWNWNPVKSEHWLREQIDRYQEKYGLDMTNVKSQAAHVAQAVLIEQYSCPNSLVIIDDTWFDDSQWQVWQGKGGAAIPYLISKGYEILETIQDQYAKTFMVALGRFSI